MMITYVSSLTQQTTPLVHHHTFINRKKCGSCNGGNKYKQHLFNQYHRRSSSKLSVSAVAHLAPLINIFPESSGVSNTRTSGINLPYQSTIKVLRTYHEQHGNLVIPRGYKVPCTEEFPPEWHNLYLSSTVYNMNWWASNVAQRPERVYELNQLQFVWERLQPEYNLVLEALIVYKSIYGHVQVPASFVVPSENAEQEGWPKATWGIPLGNCVHRIRSRGDFLRHDDTAWSRRRQLDNLGFVWDVSEQAFRKFLFAVKLYGRHEQESHAQPGVYRPLKIRSTFVVPSGLTLKGSNKTNPWPKELWGYPLGVKCSAVRSKGLYIKNNLERQKALVEVGLLPNGNSTLVWLEVVHAAAIYSKLHDKTLDVPVNFVVPAPPISSSEKDACTYQDGDEWPWPKTLWGLKLGQRLKDVRLKGAYLNNVQNADARRAQLDALGFVWYPKRGRRKRSLGATT